MKLISVSAPTRNSKSAGEFYGDLLGLTVTRRAGAVSVGVGRTQLTLADGIQTFGAQHFAFTIPSNKFELGKEWLQNRMPLLTKSQADEFEGPPAWNSRSLYFSGPDDSILEFIARGDLHNATMGPFTSRDLLCISEVGVVLDDVPVAVSELAATAEVLAFGDANGRSFAAVGDDDGLLILVETGRVWFPTTSQHARKGPLTIVASGARPGEYTLSPDVLLRILS